MAGLLYDPAQPLSLIEMVNNPAWMGVKPTLGQRNNNWGNLRTNDAFEGKTGTNKSYDTYETPEKGLRALARVLDTYSSKHGIDTIDALVNRYAPASDNTGGSHENYKKFIAQQLGVGTNDTIDVKGRRAELMDAIVRFENKNRPLASPQMLQQAIADADGTKENQAMAQSLPAFSGGMMDETFTPTPQTLPPQNNDGYGEMRRLNYTEAQIAEAKRLGLSASQYIAQQGQQTATPPQMGVVDDGALTNIDGSEIDDRAILANVPDFVRGIAGGGANAIPQAPALNAAIANGDGDGSDAADEGNQLMQSGILMSPANAATRTPSTGSYSVSQLPPEPTMSPPVSGQRRDQSAMSFPSMIDKYDMAIRIGGRGAAAASKGGLAALGAMTDEYGKIRDAENKSALDIYKAALKGDAKKAKTLQENQAQIGQIDQTIFDMDRALANLEGGNMSLTGWFDSTLGAAWDNIVGNPEAAARLLLQKLRVDDTLLRVAQTKGAISNKEMDLFMSPAPSDKADEKVWIQWIKDRRVAIQRVRDRLAGGQTVDPSQQASTAQINAFGSSQQNPATTTVSPNVAAARKALTQ